MNFKLLLFCAFSIILAFVISGNNGAIPSRLRLHDRVPRQIKAPDLSKLASMTPEERQALVQERAMDVAQKVASHQPPDLAKLASMTPEERQALAQERAIDVAQKVATHVDNVKQKIPQQ